MNRSYKNTFVSFFENTLLAEHKTLTLPASGRGFISGAPWIEKFPRPF